VYAGSALLFAALGCVIVLVGHCTLNDCAVADAAAAPIVASTRIFAILFDMCSPPQKPQARFPVCNA
jgi:hypothetical protein